MAPKQVFQLPPAWLEPQQRIATMIAQLVPPRVQVKLQGLVKVMPRALVEQGSSALEQLVVRVIQGIDLVRQTSLAKGLQRLQTNTGKRRRQRQHQH
mgnify:CR=1 FL=1